MVMPAFLPVPSAGVGTVAAAAGGGVVVAVTTLLSLLFSVRVGVLVAIGVGSVFFFFFRPPGRKRGAEVCRKPCPYLERRARGQTGGGTYAGWRVG